MAKTYRTGVAACTALLIVVAVAVLGWQDAKPAEGASGTIRVNPATQTVPTLLTNFDVTLIQNSSVATGGAQTDFTFDRTTLEIMDVALGSGYGSGMDGNALLTMGIGGQTEAQAIAEANTTTGVLENAGAFFWWGSVFLLAIPVMVLLLVIGPRLLPEYRDPEAGRIDLLSAALSLIAVLAAVYGLKQVAEHGFGWVAVVSIAASVVTGAIFLRRQQLLDDPLIDLSLFRLPAFSASLVTFMLGAMAAFGSFVFIAHYLQLVEGLSPLEAGIWSLPGALGFVVGSQVTPIIARRVRPSTIMAFGLGLTAVGFATLAMVNSGPSLAVVVAGSVLTSLGLAPVFTLSTDLIVSSAPPEKAGAASAISETGVEFGGALGIAVFGSVGAAIYRGRVSDEIPAGVSPEQSETASDTLGGATEVAVQLPDALGSALLETARGAFLSGFEIVAIVGAVIVTALAVVVTFALRDADQSSQSDLVEDREAEGLELATANAGQCA